MMTEIMTPRIEMLPGKKLIGLKMSMSLTENNTFALWRNFMPRRKEILNSIGNDLYSVQHYNREYFSRFDPSAKFEKFAAVEVEDFESTPAEMENLSLTGGMYAVFLYKGTAAQAGATFQYIFGTWLPQSAYVLDHRPHFELLGEKYKYEDPNSEEEIWIPVKAKS